VALRAGAALGAGVDHEHYRHTLDALPAPLRAVLITDLSWRRS
jgi:hypothetical protein